MNHLQYPFSLLASKHPLSRQHVARNRSRFLDWASEDRSSAEQADRPEPMVEPQVAEIPETQTLEISYTDEDDSNWENLRRSDEIARLESVLFLAREPLSSRKLAQFAEISDGNQVRRLLKELIRFYSEQPCAFQIVEVAGGFQLRSRPQFAPWLVRLQEVPVEIRLSTTATETLAIIALKQPVLRAAVEAVRGTQCGEMIRQLMEKNLVKIVGRSEDLGRPFLYGTTKYFLQVFGLNRLEELEYLKK